MCIPRDSKEKREKLIKPTPLCQGIKCSLGPGFEAKKCTPTGSAGSDPVLLQKGENDVQSGVGAGIDLALFCCPWEGVPGRGRKWSRRVHPLYCKYGYRKEHRLIKKSLR